MPRRLTRDTKNAVLGGVAAGFAEYFNIDPVLARLAFILLCFLHGAGLVIYVISWVVMPAARTPDAVPSSAGEPDAAVEPGPAPADKFVEEVRQAGESAVEKIRSGDHGTGQGRIIAGSVLIIVGGIFLLDRLLWFQWPWWLSISRLWPLILVFVGVAMILGRARGRT